MLNYGEHMTKTTNDKMELMNQLNNKTANKTSGQSTNQSKTHEPINMNVKVQHVTISIQKKLRRFCILL